MDNVVKKPFQTRLRRLQVGDHIQDVEISDPHTADDLRKSGFIALAAPGSALKAKEEAAKDPVGVSDAQEPARTLWNTTLHEGVDPVGEWPIHITDSDDYGIVVAEGPFAAAVQVAGEKAPRFYPKAAVNRDARTCVGPHFDVETSVPRPPESPPARPRPAAPVPPPPAPASTV